MCRVPVSPIYLQVLLLQRKLCTQRCVSLELQNNNSSLLEKAFSKLVISFMSKAFYITYIFIWVHYSLSMNVSVIPKNGLFFNYKILHNIQITVNRVCASGGSILYEKNTDYKGDINRVLINDLILSWRNKNESNLSSFKSPA